ncbi:MAG: endonuclease domain-containing protein [Flavipsychrobacter sp.]|nr:endonuclease domain-containing protein [Flavipsychrobacter sp.]
MANKIVPYQKHLKQLARKLRKESTLSEALLWKRLRRRALGVEFHRQVPVGAYIVDFYCHELRLAIEIDGSSHDSEEAQAHDRGRQEILEDCGLEFIRFCDRDVKVNMEGVVSALVMKVAELWGEKG